MRYYHRRLFVLFADGLLSQQDLFIILVNFPPFNHANTEDEGYAMFEEKGLDLYLSEALNLHIAESPRSLLRGLLSPDCLQRLDLAAALQHHPWLALGEPSVG